MSYNGEFSIKSESIGDCMDFIEDALTKYKLKKRDLMESLLISEEILVQLSEAAVEDSNVQVSVTRWLGVPRINFVSTGDAIDVGDQSVGVSLNELDNSENSIRNMMLHSFSDSIRYRHSKSKNYVTIITGIPERELANQTIIVIQFQVLEQGEHIGNINICRPVLFYVCLDFVPIEIAFEILIAHLIMIVQRILMKIMTCVLAIVSAHTGSFLHNVKLL